MIKLNFWQKLLLYCIYIHLSSSLFSTTSRVLFSSTESSFVVLLSLFAGYTFFAGAGFFRVKNLFVVRKNKVFFLSFFQHALKKNSPLFFHPQDFRSRFFFISRWERKKKKNVAKKFPFIFNSLANMRNNLFSR